MVWYGEGEVGSGQCARLLAPEGFLSEEHRGFLCRNPAHLASVAAGLGLWLHHPGLCLCLPCSSPHADSQVHLLSHWSSRRVPLGMLSSATSAQTLPNAVTLTGLRC